MKSRSTAAADPSPPQPAASPHMTLNPNPAGVCRRRSQMRKLAGAPGSKVPFRRAQRQAEAARAQMIPFRRALRPRRTLRDPRRLSSCCAQRGLFTAQTWAAKRARSALGGGGCKPALSQIQSRGEKRKYSTAQGSNPAWGAKRARSPLGSGGKPEDFFPVGFFESDLIRCSSGGSSTRDWASLGDGPAGLIAEFALVSDVADYVRFRAVCHPWRRCSPDPRSCPGGGLDGRFLPRRWMMLDKALTGTRCRRFLNLSTGECIRMDLPELAEHTLLALTPEGLLLLFDETTLVVRLLNPLTRRITNLPPVTTLLTPNQQEGRLTSKGELGIGGELVVNGAGLADTSTVAVCFSSPLVFAVVGNRYLDSTLPFGGRFYCAVGSRIMVLDTSSSDKQPPRLLMAVERSRSMYFAQISHTLHLVDNAGQLMMVHRTVCQDPENENSYKRKYQAYKVDLDARTLVPVKGFGGRSLFIGRRRAISITPEVFPLITADTLYLGFDCDEKTRMNQIDGYNLADGSSEPCHYDSSSDIVQPCSVIDCLSHCIRGMGNILG